MAKKEEIVVEFGDNNLVMFDGKCWVKGRGNVPADIMFIGEKPCDEDIQSGIVMNDGPWLILHKLLSDAGFDYSSVYYTLAVKYMPRSKKVKTKDIYTCMPTLKAEIEKVKPKLIVCMGAQVFNAITGRAEKISQSRGNVIPHPTIEGTSLLGIYSPAYIKYMPTMEEWLIKDIRALVNFQQGESVTSPPPDITYITSVNDLAQVKNALIAKKATLSIDMEWHGVTWMHPDRYIRTVQLGYDKGKTVIVIMRDVGGVKVMDDLDKAWLVLKELLEHPNISIIGHNVIADGHWLLSQGIDIRKNTVYDTMLAEHLLRETGPWSLDEVAMKYTNYGRYALPLHRWVKDNKALCKHGYGHIPGEILYPYAAIDVDVVRLASEKQIKQLQVLDVFDPRGINSRYPSLWDITMATQRAIYEMERNGLLVDIDRLNELIACYQSKCAELLATLQTIIGKLGIENFNPNSFPDVNRLLFDVLKLPPVRTTEGKLWADSVGNTGMDDDATVSASTDRTTLEILQDQHPVVETLLNYRRIHQVCKTWLRYKTDDTDEASREGGLPSKIWPDGKLHAHFSQLAETGRFRTSKPNVQNWPKRAEGVMVDIFGGKDKVPPGLRTIIIPSPGYVFLEADFCQAELFVLAALSGDRTMWDALNTPGRDLHDTTAISAFRLIVVDLSNHRVTEDELIKLAEANLSQGGTESPAFKDYVKTLKYIDQKGHVMTRGEFKDTIRVSAKNVNFGIPYGRGPAAIAQQVKAETSSKQPLSQLEAELTEIVKTWKEVTYPLAWRYMCDCAQAVYNPGYIINPWGRRRRFMPFASNKTGGRADMERQAQNFPIQSTVADTAMIAMDLVLKEREVRGLNFKLVNQIHDAIMLEVPKEEIEETKKLMLDTMGAIDIPVGPPFNTLRLGIDLTVFTQRWGEKD